jgi:hypothetical protein
VLLMRLPTGCLPDRETTRDRHSIERNYAQLAGAPHSMAGTTSGAVVQPVMWIHAQQDPCCVGEGLGATGDCAFGTTPWPSGKSIWREARRRQGRIEQIDEGTRAEYAIEGLIHRGWDPYREGEEFDAEEAGLGAPDAGDDIDDELFASDQVGAIDQHYRIFELDQVDDALSRGRSWGIVTSTGLHEPIFDFVGNPLKADIVLDERFIGGSENGHLMRVFGVEWVKGERQYLYQQSWSENRAGCHLPSGIWQPGCFRATERVLRNAWDNHAVHWRARS